MRVFRARISGAGDAIAAFEKETGGQRRREAAGGEVFASEGMRSGAPCGAFPPGELCRGRNKGLKAATGLLPETESLLLKSSYGGQQPR